MPAPRRTIAAMTATMAVRDHGAASFHVAPGCEDPGIPPGTVTGPEGVRALPEPVLAPTPGKKLLAIRHATKGNRVFTARLARQRPWRAGLAAVPAPSRGGRQ